MRVFAMEFASSVDISGVLCGWVKILMEERGCFK